MQAITTHTQTHLNLLEDFLNLPNWCVLFKYHNILEEAVIILKNIELTLKKQALEHEIYPKNPLRLLQYLQPSDIKVIILGQDPYHNENQADGFAFSVPHNMPIPPSLRNIDIELRNSLNVSISKHGNLSTWVTQGVFLLNTSLTVKAHCAGSHMQLWKPFTKQLLHLIQQGCQQPIVYMLWGKHAQQLIDKNNIAINQLVLESAHPSPLSAYRGFLGNQHFALCNQHLVKHGLTAINWQH